MVCSRHPRDDPTDTVAFVMLYCRSHYFVDQRSDRSKYRKALRISYPSTTDRLRARVQGNDPGGLIMIHGTPTEGREKRSGDWTFGCIAVTNMEIDEIWSLTTQGPPGRDPALTAPAAMVPLRFHCPVACAGLDHKSAQGWPTHVGFRAEDHVLHGSGDAGTEQGGRNYDQGRLRTSMVRSRRPRDDLTDTVEFVTPYCRSRSRSAMV